MKINEYIEVAAGGVAPDPFTDYALLATFQTNSPSTLTFDPTIIASSGVYAWDLGDGTIIFNDKSISHYYANSSTKTVKLYGKGTCIITQVDFNTDHIVGIADFSNSAFSTVTFWNIGANSSMTSVIFPSVIFATVSNISLNATSITGSLDLSMFTSFTSSATLFLQNTLLMTGVTFASSINGTISQLYIYSSGISGNLDLSKFSAFTSSAQIYLYSCVSMTGVTFASSITGTISQLYIYDTRITGNFDLSKFTTFTTSAAIRLSENPFMTGVTFANYITGTFSLINVSNTGVSGTLDLSKFTTFTSSAGFSLYSNPSMTGVTFASSITGTFSALNIYSNNITGVFDLSKFTSFTSSGIIQLQSNPLMTGVTFASSITGTINTLYIYSTGISGTLNISKFATFTATADVRLYSNPSMTAITFPSAPITGFIRSLGIYSNTALGYVDFTNLRTGVNSLSWDMKSNGWTAAIVNQVLSIINGISTSGFTGRIINIGGTNSDPDTTSGGFDGVAARSALQGKAFTITIT